MKAQESVDGKDRPLWWSLEHNSGLWAIALVTETYAKNAVFEGVNSSMDQVTRSHQWQSSRLALQLLMEPCGVEQSKELLPLNVKKDPSGKPYIVNPVGQAVPISLAHTVGMGAAALPRHSSIQGIGADVEQFSERFLRVVSRVACTEEMEKVRGTILDGLETEAAVLIWVIKEACYKATLIQNALFGKNQLIRIIDKKYDSLESEEQRWAGCLVSGKTEPYELIEFEAGSFCQDEALWYWAVAWTRGKVDRTNG